jgi:hypothetical protein
MRRNDGVFLHCSFELLFLFVFFNLVGLYLKKLYLQRGSSDSSISNSTSVDGSGQDGYYYSC